MAYLLVMGGLALSVVFTLGWSLVCGARWLTARLPGANGNSPRRTPRRVSTRRPKTRSGSSVAKGQSRGRAARAPSEPWRLTRWLARRRSSLPLGLLALLLYGGSRLAEYGMTFRPHTAPGAFHSLVGSLGWVCAVLLALAGMSLLAAWRCRA